MDEGRGSEREAWDAERVRALRHWLDASQSDLAEQLGTRQQTVSEWETGSSQPRRMSRRLLRMVAEESGFYEVEPIDSAANEGARNEGADDQAAGAEGSGTEGSGTEGSGDGAEPSE